MRVSRNHAIAGLAAALAVIGMMYARPWTTVREQTPPPPSRGATTTETAADPYADPSSCAVCHEQIAATYSRTGMARSFARVRQGQALADFRIRNRLHHAASHRQYTMIERDGRFYQQRHEAGFGASNTNQLDVEVDYVIGSGNHAQTFLHRGTDGRLFEMPVSWYAERGGYWEMSPGYNRAAHQDFRRVITEDCMSCHNAYPRKLLDDEGNGPRFTEALPEGIDCQRCHGPGRAHIDAIQKGNLEAGRRAIANPAAFSRERQLETCMQCHLEPTSRPLPFQIRRDNRPPFSYVPGKPLSDYFIYFDHAPGFDEDKFEIAGAAYRLRKSACFKSSGMTCTTCHDPHDIRRGQEAVQRAVAICRGCHQEVHTQATPRVAGAPAGATCLDCHMPRRRTDDAVHVVMTDHFIQRRTSVAGLLGPRNEIDEASGGGYRGEVVLYYPKELPATPENELYLAVAQVQQGVNLSAGIPRLEQAMLKYKPDRPEFAYQLAHAYAKTSNDTAVVTWSEEALRRDPGYLPALKELSEAHVRRGDFERATPPLEKAIELRPRDAFALADLANIYLRQHRIEDADGMLQRALAIDASLPRANNTMGLVGMARGDDPAAERSFRAAIVAQPDLAEAQSNLATLLARRKEYREAAFHFEQSLRSDPSSADAHHNYGLVLALMHDNARAARELRRAIDLAPRDEQAHLDLADVLASSGQRAEAAREYDVAGRSADPEVREAAAAGLRGLQR